MKGRTKIQLRCLFVAVFLMIMYVVSSCKGEDSQVSLGNNDNSYEGEIWANDAGVIGSVVGNPLGHHLLKSITHYRSQNQETYQKSFTEFESLIVSASKDEVNATNENGSNYLTAAISLRAPHEIIKALLQHGIKKEVVVFDEDSGMKRRYLDYFIVTAGYLDGWGLSVLSLLIDNDVDLSMENQAESHVLFMFAWRYPDIHLLEQVVEMIGPKRVDELMNTPNAYGQYLLHKAVEDSNLNLIKYIVEGGHMDIRHKTKKKDSDDRPLEPIEIAAIKNIEDSGRVLIDLGASVEPLNKTEGRRRWLQDLLSNPNSTD